MTRPTGTAREQWLSSVGGMNLGYLTYQAERTPSRAEQRAADAQRGELARTLAGLLHPRHAADHPGRPASTPMTVPDYLPADWETTSR